MESSYMKLYKNIANKKNKIKYNKSRHNSKQQLKKNKSLTYYHYDGQLNYINKFHINETKINNKKSLLNKHNSKNNDNNNSSFCFLSNYEYNDNILFKAYKKSVFELFKILKTFFNNEIYKYEKIKKEFMNNIQKFYNEEKKRIKEKEINNNKTPNNYNIKSYSKKKIKDNKIKNKNNEEMNISELHKNNSGNLTSLNKLKNNNYNINAFDKIFNTNKYSNCRKLNQIKENSIKNKTNILYSNKYMSRENISGISIAHKKKNNIYFNSFNNHKSLYTLIKNNNQILVNSPTKNVSNFRNDNIIKKFIKFSKNISDNKNMINKTCSQSLINDKSFSNNEKQNKINNNKKSEKSSNNNEFISIIKDGLDDNLKHIFNFSYENFLNKESERECN